MDASARTAPGGSTTMPTTPGQLVAQCDMPIKSAVANPGCFMHSDPAVRPAASTAA
jgi:hypothetical protein